MIIVSLLKIYRLLIIESLLLVYEKFYRLLKVYWNYINYGKFIENKGKLITYWKCIEDISITGSLLKIYRLLLVYGTFIDYGKLLKYINFCKFKESLLIIEGLLKLYQLLQVYGTFIDY